MGKESIKQNPIWMITPFEKPDVALIRHGIRAGAYPILHLGRHVKQAEEAVEELKSIDTAFGVCYLKDTPWEIELPRQVNQIIAPWGMKLRKTKNVSITWQVTSEEEARQALKTKPSIIILKGSEGAGFCSEETSFMLFQKLINDCRKAKVSIYIQGGVGLHSTASYLALGACGVVLDSQLALFPECSLPKERKQMLSKLSGSEIRICEGYHYFTFPDVKGTKEFVSLDELMKQLRNTDSGVLALGQDMILSSDYVKEHRRLKNFVSKLQKTTSSHIKQAKVVDAFAPDGAMAKEMETTYPIIQGPMARISDVPEFIENIADEGALPFVALSMMEGAPATSVMSKTKTLLKDKPWGVGILGFAYPKLLEEQTKLILEHKPTYVLIAGGRPMQGRAFEKAGIKTLIHVPTPGLLEMFLKENWKSYIFEGRESGGHVGPLYSTVLWEKQINRLMQVDKPTEISVYFAGGIHDAYSTAFVRLMAAPLAVRGMKIGVVCGTAYLYTEEAVNSGAITATYQDEIIKKNKTILLKSGNGQETRCVVSPTTDFFLAEKERMVAEGMDTMEMLMKLEELNLGRLRIASKGLVRLDGEMIKLTKEEQLKKGLFMTGEATALHHQVTTIAALHTALIDDSRKILPDIEAIEEDKVSGSVDVAVIGMSGIFPDAMDLDEFWRNIVFGLDSIIEVPKERWPIDLFYDPDTKDTDHVVSKWGGFIDKVDFDALEFGITPQSIAAIEPVQLLSLLVAKRALEDAGFTDLSEIDLDDTSVIFGAQGAGELAGLYGSRAGMKQMLGELPPELAKTLPRLTEDSFPGVLGNVIAGRISNRLNTGGRNYTVDAACASSLAGLDVALSELENGKSDMVILGGADLHNGLNDYLMFSSTHALSKNGRCQTFDQNADGITLGEGVGVLILKRLEDAKKDGNKIYAVIKGIGASSDGKSLGLTAPGKRGQMRALEQAYEVSGVNTSDVGLIEAHGTGTSVGDRTELKALMDIFFEDGARAKRTVLGSVKTNVGHTKCAAGVAGLFKIIDSVRYGILPPTLNITTPNEVLNDYSPFVFRTKKAGYWREKRRIAGVSGFGFGGTNFHAIVENYGEERHDTPLKAWMSELFIFPGETKEEALALFDKVEELYATNNSLRIRDLSYTLARRVGKSPIQYVIVAESWVQLLERLNMARLGNSNENIHIRNEVSGKVAFLFPGQGNQRVNMAADLFIAFPRMRKLLNKNPEYEDILYPPTVFTTEGKKAQNTAITDTRNAQPLLGIVNLAIAELLKEFGIEPDMVAGHSYGELPALSFAGAIPKEELVSLSRSRAETILASAGDGTGCMTAVFADADKLKKLLAGETKVWAVNYNSPKQTVIAATPEGMATFLERLDSEKIAYKALNVSAAFHSPLLTGADTAFAKILEGVKVSKPSLPVWSNTNAGLYPKTVKGIKESLAKHPVNAVYFTEEIKAMNKAGATVFIEVGPGSTLSGLVSEILKGQEITVIQTENGNVEGLTLLLQGLAKYIATGRNINTDRLFEGRKLIELNLDEPSAHKKPATVWNINGQRATPEYGELPAHAGKQMEGQMMNLEKFKNDMYANANANAEQIMIAYLDNMKALIDDQRDVMLGYLGTGDNNPRREGTPRQIAVTGQVQEEIAPQTILPADVALEDSKPKGLLKAEELTAEKIQEIIYEIVSEKTGYPTDMFELEMDLESDLSIDSIKKMEIIGALSGILNEPTSGDVSEEEQTLLFEQIISIKTFKDVIDWVNSGEQEAKTEEEFAGAGIAVELKDVSNELVSGVPSTSETVEINEVSNKQGSEEIIRMILVKTPCEIKASLRTTILRKTFAITDDGNGLAQNVSEALEKFGATGRIIDAKKEKALDSDGLIFIHSVAGRNQNTMMDLFNLLVASDLKRLKTILVFDDGLSHKLGMNASLPQGFAGFIKAMAHEYPEHKLASIQFEANINEKTFAKIVTDELTTKETIVELYYSGEERFVLMPTIEPIEIKGSKKPLPLDNDSVVVVTGGAQGITPYIISRMAKEHNCHYLLLGRTEMVENDNEYAAFETIEEIKKQIIEEKVMTKPKEILNEATRIFKSLSIVKALAQIEEAGGKATYMRVDITCEEEFEKALKEIKEKFGSIDGLVHGAGILEDKLFVNKGYESFARVYDTKVRPVKTVLANLLPELKLLVLFSSMASAFGNDGQCDYSAGNNVLDQTAMMLKSQQADLHVVAFDWGPWIGAGMVNPALERKFRKQGIGFVELEKGADFLLNELAYGNEASVLAIAGDVKQIEEVIATVYPKTQ